MRKFYLLSTLVLFLLACNLVVAQEFSNKGKDFYLCFPAHVPSGSSLAQMYIFITSDKNSDGVVTYNGQTQNFTVTANTVTTVPINRGFAYIPDGTGISVNKGIRVKVTDGRPPVVVYTQIYAAARTAASLVLPVNVLGRKYRTISFAQGGGGRSQFDVIAVEPNTTIRVRLVENGAASASFFDILLPNAGDVYQYQNSASQDLSGTFIESIATATEPCKKIAVFSGSSTTTINSNSCSGSSSDPLYQQCYPVTSWGKNFGVIPIAGNSFYHVRVMANENNTNVVYNGTNVVLNAGQVYPAINQNPIPETQPFFISADKPVSVSQYLLSQNCAGGIGDPEMIILNPIEQNISDITIFTSTRQAITSQFVNVLIPTTGATSFKINGASVSGFTPMPGNPQFSYLRHQFPSGDNSYTLSSDSGFNAICYGLGNVETYGYSAGTNVRDLYQYVSIDNGPTTVNFPATCKGTEFSFSMTFPFQPTQIRWLFNGLFPDVVVNSPVYDQTFTVNGKPLFQYNLPGNYSINAAGTYPIRIVAQSSSTDGCNGEQEIEYDITVYDKPSSDFNFTSNGCVSGAVNFVGNGNGNGRTLDQWHWNFGDGNTTNGVPNTTHSYTAAGSYTVKYAVTNDIGCVSDTTSKIVALNPPPTALFAPQGSLCQGKAITFNDQSTIGPGGTIGKWTWNFGDGTPVVIATTNAPQTHVFATAGTFNVTLLVESVGGCLSTVFTLPVTVNTNPTAQFGLPAGICLPSGAAQFTDQSTPGAGNITNWAWTFGDGNNSTAQSPLHNYTGTGPYNVELTVTSSTGCQHSVTQVLSTISAEPQAAFTAPAEVCLGAPAVFNSSTSTAPGSTVTQWSWTFGDGNTSNAQNPSHTYAATGSYTVTLNVTSAAGCQTVNNVATKTVIVTALPQASFTTSPSRCANQNITFTNTSVPNGGTLIKWTWNFGDGSPVVVATTGAAQTHAFATAGTFNVTLTVESSGGCVSTVFTTPVTIVNNPTAAFTLPAGICLPSGAAQFTDNSTPGSGTITNWAWNFGDGNNSTAQSPLHNYTGTGPFNVQLTVTSSNGCQHSVTQALSTISAEPQAAFTGPAEVCLGAPAVFNSSTSTAPGGTVAQWSWDFGDGNNSTAQNPSHNYATAGTYTVTLNITSAAGCPTVNNFATKTITVNPLPVADFSNSLAGCVSRNVTFTDNSTPGAGTLTKWTWNYGDGTPAVVATTGGSQTHVYTNAGNFNITLQVESSKGCVSAVVSKPITINVLPVSSFISPQVCVNDVLAPLTNTSTIPAGTITGWQWNFGDVNATGSNPNTSSLQSPTHHFTQPGTYNVQLITTSAAGCTDTLLQDVVVNGIPASNFTIAGSATSLCSNKELAITDASSIAAGKILRTEIFWDLSDLSVKTTDNSPTTGKSYTHTYPEFGSPASRTVTIRYDVYSGITCVTSFTRDITLLATPQLSFAAALPVCSTDPSFQITGAVEQNGLPGSGAFSGTGVTSTGLFNPAIAGAGSHVLTYTFTATNGCVNAITQTVDVNPTPVADAGPDKVVLEGGVVTLTPRIITNIPVTYLWSPPTGLSNPNIASAAASPTGDITYTLTVTSDKGCTTSDDVNVTLLLAPVIPNVFTPNKDGINDKFVIQFLESYPGCVVEIFNRYGQIVFRSVGYSKPWDGTYNGKEAPAGTYYYIVDPKNGRKRMSGFVDLVR